MEQQSNERPSKQGNFLSVVYDPARVPLTEYPLQLVKHLMWDLLNVRSGRVLDIGSGRGDQLHALKTLGFDIVGIDAEAPSGEPFEYHKCDITTETFPIADRSVDIVIMKSVIEHIYYFQLPFVMSEIRRVLKAGGSFVVLTPDFDYNYRTFYDAFAHCSPYTVKSLELCLRIYGFVDVHGYSLIPLPSTWHSRAMRFLADLTLRSPCPRSWGKWFRWSKERQAVAWGKAP
jgi:SAM-dependent methyltransferase